MIIAILLSLASFLLAPTIAGKLMGLKGGVAKGALIGLVTLGLLQLTGMVAQFLGPLGPVLGIMAFIACWYQVIKIVHGTDPARTLVFMFWHLFFVMLAGSLLSLIINPSVVTWWWHH